jgi:hypothetical protein
MGKGIYCNHCGTNNQPRRFRCSNCRKYIRPVYSMSVSIVALLVTYSMWLLFTMRIIPYFAHILSLSHANFSLFVQMNLELGQYFTGWGIIAGLLGIGFLFWLGLFCQPQKAYGRNIVITVVLAKAIGVMVFMVMAALDVLPFITAR